MNPLLAACGAEVVLNSAEGKERRVKVRDFFIGYDFCFLSTWENRVLALYRAEYGKNRWVRTGVLAFV